MIFLSLRVTADAEGGLKNRARCARFYRGLGAASHQQVRAGYIPVPCLPVSNFRIITRSLPKRCFESYLDAQILLVC